MTEALEILVSTSGLSRLFQNDSTADVTFVRSPSKSSRLRSICRDRPLTSALGSIQSPAADATAARSYPCSTVLTILFLPSRLGASGERTQTHDTVVRSESRRPIATFYPSVFRCAHFRFRLDFGSFNQFTFTWHSTIGKGIRRRDNNVVGCNVDWPIHSVYLSR